MPTMRPVTLEDISSAPLQVHTTSTFTAPRQRVFDLFSGDPARWGDFMPGLDHKGHWLKETPDGIGAVRSIGSGKVRITETILAKDDGKRWAFRVEKAPFPMAKAFIEDYAFSDAPGGGTTLHWTGAIWPIGPVALARPVMAPTLKFLIGRIARGVDRAAQG